MIFRFDDGLGIRRVDPLDVAQRLEVHEHFQPRHLADARDGDPVAQRIVASAALDAFGVERYDGERMTGMTEAERINLVNDFYAYLDALKKNTALPPTWPPTTGAASTGPASSGATTNNTSACGATHSGPASAAPKRSASVSPPG